MQQTVLQRLGGTRAGVWLIKHVVAPLDKWLYRRSGGERVLLGHPPAPLLLLTTRGRKSGLERTTPVFYLRDGDQLIICNVNPGHERPNPWPLNLSAYPVATVQIGAVTAQYTARAASVNEISQYWDQLVTLWPAYQRHYTASGQRTIFILTKIACESVCVNTKMPDNRSQ